MSTAFAPESTAVKGAHGAVVFFVCAIQIVFAKINRIENNVFFILLFLNSVFKDTNMFLIKYAKITEFNSYDLFSD